MATHAHAARLMLYDSAAAKDAGQSFDQQASMAKLCRRALEIVEGTSEIPRMIISRELLSRSKDTGKRHHA